MHGLRRLRKLDTYSLKLKTEKCRRKCLKFDLEYSAYASEKNRYEIMSRRLEDSSRDKGQRLLVSLCARGISQCRNLRQ